MVVFDQIESWSLNPIISSRKWVKLSEVDFPAITFCHQGNTRLEFAERLLSSADEKSLKIKDLRSFFLKHTVDYMIKNDVGIYSQNPKDISALYDYCQVYNPDCEDCSCKYYDIGFGYAMDYNMTGNQVYEKIFNDLKAHDDISTGLKVIGNFMATSSSKYNISDFLESKSKEWITLESIHVVLRVVSKTSLMNSFPLTRSIMEQLTPINYAYLFHNNVWTKKDLDDLYNFFTLPGSELNLIAISHFYTMNDFGSLGRDDLFSFWNRLYLGGVPSEFQSCFKHMYSSYYGKEVSEEVLLNYNYGQNQKIPSFLEPSPCMNLTKEHECQSYCNWHEIFFKESITKKEFLTIMKNSLPQRKLLAPKTAIEVNLTRKVFPTQENGDDNHQDQIEDMNEDQTLLASMPFMIFCRNIMDQNWLGDDIGMASKFCSDFYSTPTDQGLCLTKNMNLEDQMRMSKEFTATYEINKEKIPMKNQVGPYNSEATFVINTNAKHPKTKTFLRSPLDSENYYDEIHWRTQKVKEVFFQIHSTNELPQIHSDSSQSEDSHSLTLKAGHEYFIQVMPFGQSVTTQFKTMSYGERNCLLPEELPESSSMKVYSKQNCKYECKVRYSIEKCACLPWDFPLNVSNHVNECDIFGRTCFHNAMKQSISCPDCLDACQFTKYHKTKIIDQELNLGKVYSWSNYYAKSSPCHPRDFCEYVHDDNNTIEPKTWYEELTEKSKIKADKFLADHIIVHVNFASPEVEWNILDARYSFYDQVSNLGGTIGLCEQITGASLLTVIHLMVLLIKSVVRYFSSKSQNRIVILSK